MPGVPAAIEPETADSIGPAATTWVGNIQSAQGRLVGIGAPGGMETAHRLYVQATQLYVSAAKTFGLVDEVGTEARDELLQRASEQRDQAALIWDTGTQLLDAERRDAELAPSSLSPPSVPGSVAPTPDPGAAGDGQGQGDGGN